MSVCCDSVQGLVEYYKQNSLKEGFRTLDTTLQVPYKELARGLVCRAPGKCHTRILSSASLPCSFNEMRQSQLHTTFWPLPIVLPPPFKNRLRHKDKGNIFLDIF